MRVTIAACGLLFLAGCNHEASDWKAASAANTTAAYQQFLYQYPNSPNAAVAQTRIEQLQEAQDWQAATAADTRDGYQQYLAQHPDGPDAQEARIRLENFAQASSPAVASANTAVPATTHPSPLKPSSGPGPTPNMATGGAGREPAAAGTSGTHYVQLGAFSSRARAESHWKHLASRFSRELAALTPRYVAGKSHTLSVVRLQVPVSSRAQGEALCEKLRAHAQPCVQVSAG